MEKKYAAVFDVSPSEQLTGSDESLRALGIVIGLQSPRSFEEVGPKHPDPSMRMPLRKWAGASTEYKANLIAHVHELLERSEVMCGAHISDEYTIRRRGRQIWERYAGPFPAPHDHSRKGRPRHLLGGYVVDGAKIAPWVVLEDDLIVLGWYCEAITSLHAELCSVNGDYVKLDVLVDRLPNEQGDQNKAVILKDLLSRATSKRVALVGVPEQSDFEPRDLLADNIAGLARQAANGNGDAGGAIRLYRQTIGGTTRRFCTPTDPA